MTSTLPLEGNEDGVTTSVFAGKADMEAHGPLSRLEGRPARQPNAPALRTRPVLQVPCRVMSPKPVVVSVVMVK